MRGLLLSSTALLLISPAVAQGVLQSGPATTGHIATWAGTGLIKDGGSVTANDTLAGASATSITSSSTYYCSSSGCGTSQAIAALVPFTGTLANLNVSVATAPSSGQTVTATLMTGTYGSLIATSITCQIAGTATSCQDLTHEMNLVAGQAWAIRLVTSSGATSTAGESFGVQFISSTLPSPTSPYVLQSGQITSGHFAGWVTDGVIGDIGGGPNGVVGPSSSILNNLVCWGNTGGTLLSDCGYNFGAPPPFGNVTPNTGAFTTLNVSGAQTLSISPTGNPTGGSILTTYSSFNIQTNAVSGTNREFLVSCGLTSAVGSGIIGTVNDGKVCSYSGIVGNAGTGSIWSRNSVTQLSAGSGSYNAQGDEIDVNNLVGDRLATTNSFNLASPFVAGENVSGDGSPAFRNTYAFVEGGGLWQYGFAAFSDVSDSAFYEATSPGSTYGLNLRGAHTYGWYVNSASAVNIANGPIGANLSGNAIIAGYSFDIRSGTNNRLLVNDQINLSNGTIIYSANDANNGLRGLEFGASAFLFSGGVVTVNSAGLSLQGSSSGVGNLQAPAAASTYVWTFPAATDTIAGIAATQTLTNKTLTSPIFSGTVIIPGYAISGLPTCNGGAEGAIAYVTNGQTSPSFLGTVSSTGAVIAPVFCNGSAWVYG